MNRSTTLSPQSTSLTAQFAGITKAVLDTLLGHSMLGGTLSQALYSVLRAWVFKHVVRIRLLIAALQDGTVRTRRSPAPGLALAPSSVRAAPAWMPPRRLGWLRTMVPGHLLPGAWMQSLVEEPEMLALLAASPRLVRTMKPLCRALGVTMPKVPKPVPATAAGPEGAAEPGRSAPTVRAAPAAAAGERESAGRPVARWGAGDARLRQ
jgi:hypothetical protein